MRYKLLSALVFISCGLQAQQVNPVPDYVFANRMSVGRNAVTDTLAYFSIGPRYGAIRGFMPPMVVDTALVTGGTKRNGLTIFSIQKNKYVYWDSVGSKWAEMAGTGGSAINSGDTATMLSPYTRGSGTTNYVPKFTGSRTLGNSQIFDNGTNVGINNTSPLAPLHVGNGTTAGSSDPLIVASRVINSGSGNSRGFSDATNYARSGGTAYASYDARISMTGTNDFGHYAAFQSGPTLNFTGTITDVFNYISSPTYTAGTVTNSYGTYIQNPVKTGATLTNNYGHYFPSVFNAGTNNWVFYNASTERVYSGGDIIGRKFFAGSNSVASPSAQFHADGSGDIKLRLQQSGYNYWDFTSVSGQTYATISDVSGTYMTFFNLGNVALGTTTNNGYKLDVQGSLRNTTSAYFSTTSGEVYIGTTSDAGAYALQVAGSIYNTTTITTGAPTSGSAKPWRLGEAATVSPTSPNRTIRVEIDGTVYYLHAKTTND